MRGADAPEGIFHLTGPGVCAPTPGGRGGCVHTEGVAPASQQRTAGEVIRTFYNGRAHAGMVEDGLEAGGW